MKRIMLIFSIAYGVARLASAATIYVDDDNYGRSGDGSAANPYGTIQEAVAAASTEEIDTISVAAGTYGRDSTLISGSRHARVKIDRRVNIVGAGQDKTFVVGSRDSANPIGGFYIASGGYGSKIEKMTVSDCEVPTDSEYGGAFGTAKSNDPTTNCYIVAYCTVTNCAAYRGGGMLGGFAFSCKFIGNTAKYLGGAIYRSSAYNCLVTDSSVMTVASSSNGGCAYDYGWLVNCTVMNNYDERGAQATSGWRNTEGYACSWNTISASNKAVNNDAYGVYTNGVIDASKTSYYNALSKDVTLVKVPTNLVINAIGGDFSPVKGGLLDAKGVVDYLSLDFIPPEYQGRGFDGEPWTGDVPIGALFAAKEAKSSPLILTQVKVFGKETPNDNTVVYADVWPRQIYVEPRQADAAMCTDLSCGQLLSTIRRYLGTKSGSWFLFPPKTEVDGVTPVSPLSISPTIAKRVLWVDDDAVFDGIADGSEEKPYKTIQAAVDEIGAVAATQTIVKVCAGYYTNGVFHSSIYNCKARVVLPEKRNIQIIAVDGPEKTFVTGEPDPVTGGIGENSVRCFASPNNTSLCIAGFTLMNGYASTEDASGGAVRGGGWNQQVWDCVFTGNHTAESGSCVNLAQTFRCLFTNNTDSVKGCVINAATASSIFANNATSTHGYMPLYNSCQSYGCTIYEPEASSTCYLWNSNVKAFNNVVVAGGMTTQITINHGILAGNVIGNVKTYSGSFTDEQQLHANPYVAFPAALDFRLTVNSPALAAGRCTDAQATTTASENPLRLRISSSS